eukprot:scaffold45851_cov20-Tisochrysis_lutea.AAC.1
MQPPSLREVPHLWLNKLAPNPVHTLHSSLGFWTTGKRLPLPSPAAGQLLLLWFFACSAAEAGIEELMPWATSSRRICAPSLCTLRTQHSSPETPGQQASTSLTCGWSAPCCGPLRTQPPRLALRSRCSGPPAPGTPPRTYACGLRRQGWRCS